MSKCDNCINFYVNGGVRCCRLKETVRLYFDSPFKYRYLANDINGCSKYESKKDKKY